MNFNQQLTQFQTEFQKTLTHYLEPLSSSHLYPALQYVVLNGGKRLRPFCIYLTGAILQLKPEQLSATAAAIEFIHCYSLVHDDLPAMDNADLRRGKATCHKQFDEATAILVGDALLTYAFEIIAQDATLNDHQKIQIIQQLAQASGPLGMVQGQALDLAATHHKLKPEALLEIYRRKTGDLFRFSLVAPAFIANIDSKPLAEFADCLGLAFQLQDDLLDIETTSAITGKTSNADLAANKFTYPHATSIAETKQMIHDLHHQALAALKNLPFNSDNLNQLATYLLQRQY